MEGTGQHRPISSIWTYRWFHQDGTLSIDEVADDIASLLMRGYLR